MKGFMKRAERVNAVLCALCFAAVFAVYGWGWELASAGFGIGASVVNIRVLGWLTNRLMNQGNPGASGRYLCGQVCSSARDLLLARRHPGGGRDSVRCGVVGSLRVAGSQCRVWTACGRAGRRPE